MTLISAQKASSAMDFSTLKFGINSNTGSEVMARMAESQHYVDKELSFRP